MNSSNANNFDVDDNLESSFTEISSIEMDMAKIMEKMQKMETELLKFGKIEKELRKENGKMKDQIAGMKAEFAEKIVELNAKHEADKSMLDNLIENFDRINAQLMPPKFDSMELKKNKMDSADCAPKLSFAKNGLLVTSNENENGWKCARAILSVPKFDRNAKETYIAFYFEGHIKQTNGTNGLGHVGIGFCPYQFPLEGNFIGQQKNSIGIHWKDRMNNCGGKTKFQDVSNPFKTGDKIGLGLICEPKDASIKCFAICNRKLLGSVELSSKFFDVPIYPVVGLFNSGNSIQLNFGQEEWDFDPSQLIQ